MYKKSLDFQQLLDSVSNTYQPKLITLVTQALRRGLTYVFVRIQSPIAAEALERKREYRFTNEDFMNWLKSIRKCCVKEKTYFICLSHRLFHIHNKFSFEKSEKTVHTFTITSTCLHAGMQLVLKVCNANENQQVDSLISLTNKPPSEENSVNPTLP